MATLEKLFPALDGREPSYCTHEWVQGMDNGRYTGEEHLLLTAYGGRPGYAAVIINEPEEIRPWVEEALAQGWKRFEVSGCGYGDPLAEETLEEFRKELLKALDEVSNGA